MRFVNVYVKWCQVRAAVAANLGRRQTDRLPARTLLPRHNVVSCQPYSSGLGNDKPKPFLNSEAHKFKVEDAYVLTEEEQRRGKYGKQLGLFLFCVVMYFAFIRDYGEKDKAVVDFLTKDISDKVPPHKMAKIKQQLEEEKEMYKGIK